MIVIFSVRLLLLGGKGRWEEGGAGKKKKIVSGLIEFVISLAVPDRWIHEYCLDALCLSGAVVSKDKQ